MNYMIEKHTLSHQKQSYLSIILLIALILFHIFSNFLWLKADSSIPKHDENEYLAKSIRCYRLLGDDKSGKITRLLDVEPKIRPHLFPLTAIPFYLLRGISYDSAALSNSIFMALLILAVYGIGREIGGARQGLAAAFIASFYPFILIFSHSFWSETPLMAVFAGTLYLLIKTRDFQDRIYSVLLGLLLAIGMLLQQRFIFFAVTPFIIIACRALLFTRNRDNYYGTARVGVNILLCLVIAAAFTIPYYLHYYTVFSTKLSYGVTGGAWEPVGSTFGLASFTWYLGQILKETSLFFFVLFIAATVSLLFKLNRKRAFLLLSLLGGYLIITIFPSKDARYICPLLPLAALVTTNGLYRIRIKPIRIIVGGLIIIFALGNYLRVNWNIGPFKMPYHKSLLSLPLLPEPLELIPSEHPPIPYADWRWDEIIKTIREDMGEGTGRLLVAPYLPEFNAATFNYFCLIHGISLKCLDMGTKNLYHYNFRNLLDSDYIITKNGKTVPYSHIRFEFAEKTAEMLENPPPPFLKNHATIAVFPLPDGSEARLIKRDKPISTEEKIVIIEESIKIDPIHPWAYLTLGRAYLDKAEPARALRNFEKVIELLPDWPGGYLDAGRANLIIGHPEEALRLVKKGLALAPEFPFAHYVLGTVYEEIGDIEKALQEYNIALSGKPVLVEKARKRIDALMGRGE